MQNNRYRLRYLPLFYDDLNQKIMYISDVLHNKAAANKLLDSVESAIKERQFMAEAFEPYESLCERQHPYYRIYVGNFVVFYVVIDEGEAGKVMEVRRFLYNKQDVEQKIWYIISVNPQEPTEKTKKD